MKLHPMLPLLLAVLSCAACSNDVPQIVDPGSAPFAIVTRVDGELWQGDRQLKAGDSIDLGHDVEVRDGRAVISLSGVGSVQLYPKTRVTISGTRRIKLLLGKLWALIETAPDGGFEVETDDAVAGVRGTEFLVERTAQKTRIGVAKGRVVVTNRKTEAPEVVLDPGQQSEVIGEAPPTEPTTFDVEEEHGGWEPGVREGTAPLAPPADGGAENEAAPTEPTAPASGPKPGVKVDRKAMEKVEKQGEEKKQELKREAEKTGEELEKEENKEREKMEKPREDVEKDLEKDMGTKGSLEPKAGSLKEESIRPKKGSKEDSEMEDFLK